MPRFRQSFRPRARSTPRYQKTYASEQTGIRRHQLIQNVKGPVASSDASSLAPQEYAVIDLLRFQRTFDIGTTDDVAPTPTASNNYQSNAVFNGSAIRKFNAKIKIKSNSSSQTQYYDVYEMAMSFYDVLVWNTISVGTSLLTFDTTAGSPGNNKGAVLSKTPTSSLLSANTVKNFKFIQHYLKFKGTITISANDANRPTAEININQLPAKVRRSQTGMYYGIVLHNDTIKNDGSTITQTITSDISFEEIPSDHRLPYID